jgi:glycosyltransferase involved in cell wall biosynthesis
MKLLVVSQYFWPENFRINDLVAELVRRGHEVTVLTGEPNYPTGEIFADYMSDKDAFASYAGAEIIRVPLRPRHQGSCNLILNYLSFVWSATLRGPFKLIGRRFDAMFVYQPSPVTVGLPALLLKAIKRTPAAFWVLDLWPQSLSAVNAVHSGAILRLVDGLVRLIYAGMDLILVQSRSFIGEISRQAGGDRKIRYFPSWSDYQASEKPVKPTPAVPAASDLFSIMFTGNIGDAQDFPAILESVELLRDEPVRWLIVGDGRRSEWLAQEIARRGLDDRVLLLGRHPLESMPSFLLHADATLVVLRSDPAFSMTIPGKVQTYLAAGKPILAMIDGEGGDVIRAANAGLVTPAGNTIALAGSIRQMMAMSPDQRAEMGSNGRVFAYREFDRNALVNNLESWLDELVTRKQSRRKR